MSHAPRPDTTAIARVKTPNCMRKGHVCIRKSRFMCCLPPQYSHLVAMSIGGNRQLEGTDGIAKFVGQHRQVVDRASGLLGACSRLLRHRGDLAHRLREAFRTMRLLFGGERDGLDEFSQPCGDTLDLTQSLPSLIG